MNNKYNNYETIQISPQCVDQSSAEHLRCNNDNSSRARDHRGRKQPDHGQCAW